MSEQKFITTQQLADAWNISDARVRRLRLDGRIEGATEMGGTWVYPARLVSEKPPKQKPGPKK